MTADPPQEVPVDPRPAPAPHAPAPHAPAPHAPAPHAYAPRLAPSNDVRPAARTAAAPAPAAPAAAPVVPAEPAPAVDEDAAERLRSSLREGVANAEESDTPIGAAAAAAVRLLTGRGFEPFPSPPALRVITVANQKGGVGKTTSTVNLAVALALHGAKVLVVDLDPQGNASTALGVEHHVGTPDVYAVLVGGRPIAEVVQPADGVPGLWCVPATIDLAGAEIELVSMVARESRLQRAIQAYVQAEGADLDYVLVDCPPSLGLLTVNAMVATQEVLIPIQCEYYALEGLSQLLKTIELVRANLNPELAVSTILLTMYDGRTRLADQVAQEVRSHFGDVVLSTLVPRSVRVSEAPGYGQSVITYDPGSRGAVAYVEAAREIARRGSAA
jgi:chromosome partitioning protein